jgi:hypothetical protein
MARYPSYLLYEYKSTKTDAEGAARSRAYWWCGAKRRAARYLALLVQKYLLTSTKVLMLVVRSEEEGGEVPCFTSTKVLAY